MGYRMVPKPRSPELAPISVLTRHDAAVSFTWLLLSVIWMVKPRAGPQQMRIIQSVSVTNIVRRSGRVVRVSDSQLQGSI